MANDITAYNRAYDDVLRRVRGASGVVVALLDNPGLDRYLADALNCVLDSLCEARDALEALEELPDPSEANAEQPTGNELAIRISNIQALIDQEPGVYRVAPDILDAAVLLARTLEDLVADLVDKQAPDQTEPAHEV